MWPVREKLAKTILTPTSGFIRSAGFTHSLTPARNCTYGCTYCYVPTMGLFGGVSQEEAARWGQFTTQKVNAAKLAARESKPHQAIYCSPSVDPYQPAEGERPIMPELLDALAEHPPNVFVVQTRGPLILRDLERLHRLAQRTTLRISFSVTTDRDDVRRRYEPHCESNEERLQTIRVLRESGLEVFATLAPLLPCNPERLTALALEASHRNVIGDPLHIRDTKAQGATTRPAAWRVAAHHGEEEWFEARYQREILRRIGEAVAAAGYQFASGPEGFSWLAQPRDLPLKTS